MDSCIIIISHSNYRIYSAGVEKSITEITNIIREAGVHIVHLFPVIEINKVVKNVFNNKYYVGAYYDDSFMGILEWKKAIDFISIINESFKVERVQIHHFHGWDLERMSLLLKIVNAPIDLFVHDMDMICPFYLFEDALGIECRKSLGRPEMSRCNKCKYYYESYNRFIRIYTFLRMIRTSVDCVLCPSDSCKKIWGNAFDGLFERVIVRDHLCGKGQKYPEISTDLIRIAYLGTISHHKGLDEWRL